MTNEKIRGDCYLAARFFLSLKADRKKTRLAKHSKRKKGVGQGKPIKLARQQSYKMKYTSPVNKFTLTKWEGKGEVGGKIGIMENIFFCQLKQNTNEQSMHGN